MECYVNLREMGTAINIRLTDTWWRHYQVLHSSGILASVALVVP